MSGDRAEPVIDGRRISSRASLDTQARYRPADHELLDLLGAFEDVVDHCGPSSWCFSMLRNPVTRYFASGWSFSSTPVR